MEESNTWDTRRQKLIKLLTVQKAIIDLRSIMREMEYPNKKALVNDVQSIAKTLKNEGQTLVVKPPSCMACGYTFHVKKEMFKIPSKCPKCREQRINWPSIKVVN